MKSIRTLNKSYVIGLEVNAANEKPGRIQSFKVKQCLILHRKHQRTDNRSADSQPGTCGPPQPSFESQLKPVLHEEVFL